MAEKYSTIQLSKCETIQPYCIAPWVRKLLVHIPVNAEIARTQAKPQQGLTAVLSTSSQHGILGAGGAFYSPVMPHMTEAGLNTFSLAVLSQKDSNTYATDLYAVNHSLKLMATACKDVSVQVYTHNKLVLQSIQKPCQQSGQELLREIYETTQILYENRCTVELFWILKKGSNGCVRAMVSSRPSQNQKRKARAAKTEEGKTICNCLKVMI